MSEDTKVVKKEEKTEEKEKKSAVEQMEDLQGLAGEGVEVISKRAGKFIVMPSAISDLPKFQENFEEWHQIAYGSKDEKDKTKKGFMSQKSCEKMAEIIHMGLKYKHPDMTIEKCSQQFSISDFGKILVVMLDLNDFFSSVKEIGIQTAQMVRAQKESVK